MSRSKLADTPMNLVQELMIHFWEEGRLKVSHVVDLVARNIVDWDFVDSSLTGFRDRQTALMVRWMHEEYTEEAFEDIQSKSGGKRRSSGRRKSAGRLPLGHRRESKGILALADALAKRSIFPALLELGKAVAPGRSCPDNLSAAVALSKCDAEALKHALAAHLSLGDGRLCQILAWLDLGEIRSSWDPAWGSGVSLTIQVPLPAIRRVGRAPKLAIALSNARQKVMPALTEMILENPDRLGTWIGCPEGMPGEQWENLSSACLLVANTVRLPGRWRRLSPGAPLSADPSGALETAMSMAPKQSAELLEVVAKLSWDGPSNLRVPPKWPASRMLGR